MDRSRAAKVWKRTIIGLALIGAVTLLLKAIALENGVELLAGTAAIFGFWCLHELDHMHGRARLVTNGVQLALVAVLFAWAWYPFAERDTCAVLGVLTAGTQQLVIWKLAGAAVVVALVNLLAHKLLGARDKAPAPVPFIARRAWVLVPFVWSPFLRADYGIRGIIALVILSKIGDIAGYYVGSAIGRSHPFPRISPGKTTAGCVGSLVAGVAFGGILSMQELLPPGNFGVATGFIAGGILNIAAQAGDLLESFVKRSAGVKDSGVVFGPAGGALDLLDSLLLTVPTAVLTWPLLFG